METTGHAVVVDPRRDVEEYLADAADHGLTIAGAINTHFQPTSWPGTWSSTRRPDTGSGTARWPRPSTRAVPGRGGERIELGAVVLEVMETPGHTPESISLLVYEHRADAVPNGVLTGDALFIGDVVRPDPLHSRFISSAPLPTDRTLRMRSNIPFQAWAFAHISVRMARMIRRGHAPLSSQTPKRTRTTA